MDVTCAIAMKHLLSFMHLTDTIQDLESPGVDVHCLHGVGVPTPSAFKYSSSQWYDKQPDVMWGDGDGTVNIQSLAGCLRWVGLPYTQVFYRQFAQAEHIGILQNLDVLQYIATVLQM
jgi:lysophospholipase-3